MISEMLPETVWGLRFIDILYLVCRRRACYLMLAQQKKKQKRRMPFTTPWTLHASTRPPLANAFRPAGILRLCC